MARFEINDYMDIGTIGYHDATTWEVALDEEFTQVIDTSVHDFVNVTTWNSPLPVINGEGVYKDLDKLYLRVKIHIGDTTSPWYVAEYKNQNKQIVNFVENDEIVESVDSLEIGFN